MSTAGPTPTWLYELLEIPPVEETGAAEAAGVRLELRDGMLRAPTSSSDAQAQTARSFGFKWAKRETFESKAMRDRMREWLVERYGDVENAVWWDEYGASPIVDAGCGAAYSAVELLSSRLRHVHYLGIDDYVRDRLQELEREEAWNALIPLTRLGKALDDLHVEVDVPEDVDLLEIPAGAIDVQRLFYWHVLKAYHGDDLDLEELNHINYDWYAPKNAHRQSPEEVRTWCGEAGLEIERENVQQAGITIVARKTD